MPIPPPTPKKGGPFLAPGAWRGREQVYAPSRSAVPVPGSRPVVGSGLFRKFRATGAVGCMLLVFLAVGVGILSFGLAGTVGPYKKGVRGNNDPRSFLGMMVFGTVFCLVALRILQVALAGAGYEMRTKGGESPTRGWTRDHPWSRPWMAPDYSGGGSGAVLGRVAILALFGMFNLAWGSPSWVVRGIVLLFDLFGLLLLYDSLQKLVQWLRFRRPVVLWSTLPALLGGTLQGRIAFARPLRAGGPPRLTLRCVRDEWTTRTSGESEIRELAPWAIYRQTLEVPLAGTPGEPLDFIDFSFELPRDLPGTDLFRDEPIYWQVLVQVPIAGPDFETVFLAPVYSS